MDKSIMQRAEYEMKKYEEVYHRKLPKDLVEHIFNIMFEQCHSGFSANYVFRFLRSLNENEEKTLKTLDTLIKKSTNKEGMQYLIDQNIRDLWAELKKCDNRQDREAIIKLLAFQPLTPLLGTDDEWGEPYISRDRKVQQNKRKSSVFREYIKEYDLWIAYDVDRNAYSDNGGINWFSTGRFGNTQITFPYVPKEVKTYLLETKGEYDPRTYVLTDKETIEKIKQINKERYSKL